MVAVNVHVTYIIKTFINQKLKYECHQLPPYLEKLAHGQTLKY